MLVDKPSLWARQVWLPTGRPVAKLVSSCRSTAGGCDGCGAFAVVIERSQLRRLGLGYLQLGLQAPALCGRTVPPSKATPGSLPAPPRRLRMWVLCCATCSTCATCCAPPRSACCSAVPAVRGFAGFWGGQSVAALMLLWADCGCSAVTHCRPHHLVASSLTAHQMAQGTKPLGRSASKPVPCCAAFHATCLQARQTLLHTLQEEVAARRAAAQELRCVVGACYTLPTGVCWKQSMPRPSDWRVHLLAADTALPPRSMFHCLPLADPALQGQGRTSRGCLVWRRGAAGSGSGRAAACGGSSGAGSGQLIAMA